jgi:hypothetical protein
LTYNFPFCIFYSSQSEFLSNYPWDAQDRYLIDAPCPWHQYYFTKKQAARGLKLGGLRIPFINLYDGLTLHRLVTLHTQP